MYEIQPQEKNTEMQNFMVAHPFLFNLSALNVD